MFQLRILRWKCANNTSLPEDPEYSDAEAEDGEDIDKEPLFTEAEQLALDFGTAGNQRNAIIRENTLKNLDASILHTELSILKDF